MLFVLCLGAWARQPPVALQADVPLCASVPLGLRSVWDRGGTKVEGRLLGVPGSAEGPMAPRRSWSGCLWVPGPRGCSCHGGLAFSGHLQQAGGQRSRRLRTLVAETLGREVSVRVRGKQRTAGPAVGPDFQHGSGGSSGAGPGRGGERVPRGGGTCMPPPLSGSDARRWGRPASSLSGALGVI